MTGRYQVLPSADQDLDGQGGYLLREAGLETALRVYDAAAACFDQLARMPGMGERWESAHPRLAGLQVFPIKGFQNHLVFYRQNEAGIEIVRVLHGARDIVTVLEEGDPL